MERLERPFPIDLILTDIVMPGMNGRQLVDRLRDRLPDAAVLYMSGYTDDAIVRRGVIEPGTEFLGKPFGPAALLNRVREVLDRHRSEPARRASQAIEAGR